MTKLIISLKTWNMRSFQDSMYTFRSCFSAYCVDVWIHIFLGKAAIMEKFWMDIILTEDFNLFFVKNDIKNPEHFGLQYSSISAYI